MKSIEKLNHAIKEYQDIQETQIFSLDTELLPDIETLNFERASAFAELKNNLDHFLNFSHSESNIELIQMYKNILDEMLNTDTIIKNKIIHHKNSLKQHMKDISNNKKAIHNYAKSAKQSPKRTIRFTG